MDNTHSFSLKLENIFGKAVPEDFLLHIAGEFDGEQLYDSIIFWCGVRVGYFISKETLPTASSLSNKIKDDFYNLKCELEFCKGKSWSVISIKDRDIIIQKVSDFVNSF